MNKAAHKILLVDDELDILDFLSYYLKQQGYQVMVAENGNKALEILKTFSPDLILLDIMMPEMSGLEVCTKIRAINRHKNVLIAFLTAQIDDQIQIEGFDRGADDYISKPIKIPVLVSRIEALIRRRGGHSRTVNESAISINGLELDMNSFELKKEGKILELAKKEFLLLYLLASRPGKVFNREEILNSVWGEDIIVGDRTVDVHIRKVREKLGGDYIKTLKGVGYKFVF